MQINIDRLRGFGLAALHGAIALLSLMLVYAGYAINGKEYQIDMWVIVALTLVGALSAFVNFQTCIRLMRLLKARATLPAPDLAAFGIMLALMLIATQIFP